MFSTYVFNSFFSWKERRFSKLLSSSPPIPSMAMSSEEPAEGILHFCYTFLIFSISFINFLRVSFSLLTLPICSCMFFITFDGILNTLIIVVLCFLLGNSRINVISESGSDASSHQTVFSCSFSLASSYFAGSWTRRTG